MKQPTVFRVFIWRRLRYAPGASTDEPGRRFDDVPGLRKIFKDVFTPYLEDKFNVKDATMFRLVIDKRIVCILIWIVLSYAIRHRW